MLKINPTQNISFLQTENKKNNTSKNDKIALGAGGAVIATVLAISVSKVFRKNLTQVLKKQGVELKNNIAVITENSKKFTGDIKLITGTLGLSKEIIKYEDGVMVERLCYDFMGKEKEGFFYNKNGKLRLSIMGKQGKKNTFYGYTTFDKNAVSAEGRMDGKQSIFEYGRNLLKEIEQKP